MILRFIKFTIDNIDIENS